MRSLRQTVPPVPEVSESDAERTMSVQALALSPDRRRTEALLLAMVVVITAGGYAYVGYSMLDRLPPGFVGFSMAVLLLAIVAHVAVRLWAPRADPLILPIALLLTGLGWFCCTASTSHTRLGATCAPPRQVAVS